MTFIMGIENCKWRFIMGIKVLSLFDGMSCGQIAFEELGMKVNRYVAYEIDKYPIKVTQHNYSEHRTDG